MNKRIVGSQREGKGKNRQYIPSFGLRNTQLSLPQNNTVEAYAVTADG